MSVIVQNINVTLSTTTSTTITISMMNLDDLLSSLAFDTIKTVYVTFVLPIVNIVGLGFCSLSAWIFTNKKFHDPVFFYYRLLCLVYIIHLLHNILRGLLYSPKFFPTMNTYLSSIYQIYYSSMSGILFHYEETLQMAIILTRMKIYNTFVKKHFKARPWIISLSFFLTCFLIDAPYAILSFKVGLLGTYFYTDSNGLKQSGAFYFPVSSNFSVTTFGRILLAFTTILANLGLLIVVGTALNIVSLFKYKSHVSERKQEVETLEVTSSYNRVTIRHEIEQQKQREKNDRQIEKNMLYMALTLSTISIVSRIIFMFTYIYYFIYNSNASNRIVYVINYTIYTLTPTIAIFVFYSFNKAFRHEFKKKILRKRSVNPYRTPLTNF